MTGLAADYENEEIAKNGVSVQDVIAAIGKKKPRIAILMLDACRALAQSTADDTETYPGADFGKSAAAGAGLPQGTIVVYSASFGESAIEKFRATITPQFLVHRGRPLRDAAAGADPDRIRPSASGRWSANTPERRQAAGARVFPKSWLRRPVRPGQLVGGERFALKQDQCEGAKEDWDDISRHPQREAMERHQPRFHDCPTAELARRALVAARVRRRISAPTVAASNKQIDDCDRLAAADNDPARPPEVAGVPLDKIDYARRGRRLR